MSRTITHTCFICLKDVEKGKNFQKVSNHAFGVAKSYSSSYANINLHKELHSRLDTTVFAEGIISHRSCYSSLTNKNKLQDAITTFRKNQGDLPKCVFCLGDEDLSVVSTEDVSHKMYALRMDTKSESTKHKLSIISNPTYALENRIRYHKNCFNTEWRKISPPDTSKEDKLKQVMFESYFVNIVKNNIIVNKSTMDFSELEELYKKLELEQSVSNIQAYNYKHRIKQLLVNDHELSTSIQFLNSHKKPTVIASKCTIESVVCNMHYENKQCDTDSSLVKVSKMIRKELNECESWTFSGEFASFVRPPNLEKLMKMIIGDPSSHPDLSQKKIDEISTLTRNICDIIYSNFKSDKSLKYKSRSQSDRGFEKTRLSPLTVGTSLLSYKNNRSKEEIRNLFDLGFGISYDKLEKIVTAIGMAVIKKGEENGLGIFLPPFLVKGVRPIFAADNIDLGSDRASFHGADLMISQRGAPSQIMTEDLQSLCSGKQRSLPNSVQKEMAEVFIPMEKNLTICSKKLKNPSEITSVIQLKTKMWLLSLRKYMMETDDLIEGRSSENVNESSSKRTLEEHPQSFEETEDVNNSAGLVSQVPESKSTPPSWSAFNSLLSKKSPTSNSSIVPPLFIKSPTNTYILLEILKRAQNINTLIFEEGQRTMITLDGDLFVRAVQLKDYKKNWIIRLGSLHQIIAALKTLGKYVEDSGIDMAWETSGIYGSATVRQIIEGRHIYRGIEAHTITLISLFHLNSDAVLSKDDLDYLDSILSKISDCRHEDFPDLIKEAQLNLTLYGIFEKLTKNQNLNDVTKFFHNYMNQVFNLLNFIAATRNSDWQAHLASAEEMCIYFHAHDQLNYAKWVVLYLADMLELKTSDPKAWKFLNDGNFTVTATEVPFTSIDPDHAIEHKHRGLKAKGGFVGTTQSQKLIDRFALTVPMLFMFADKFKSYAGMKTSCGQLHHELVGNMFKTRLEKAKLLTKALTREGNPVLFTDLCNFVNFSVPSEEIKKNVANRDQLGKKAFDKFWEERISENRTVPFWDTLHKNNFKFFSSQMVTVKSKNSSQKTTLKEERHLYSRLLFASRSRLNLNIKAAIGDYEFCSFPPSNFTATGDFIKTNDKHKLFGLMNKLPKGAYKRRLTFTGNYSIFIIDGMRLVNEIQKTDQIKMAKDFAKEFLSRLERFTKNYSEIRLLFDQYIEKSLKNSTRDKRNISKKPPIHFHVNDTTPIGNLDQFLAHWKTKHELTKYLGDKVIKLYKHNIQKVMVAYQGKFIANCPLGEILNLPCMLSGKYNLEEADQLVLLNCVDIGKQSETRKQSLTVYAVLLINFYDWIPANTEIRRVREILHVGDFFERLGETKAKAFIGWYTFQATDNTGSFAGKGIITHFNTFMVVDTDILQAFTEFGATSTISEFVVNQMERYVCQLYRKTFEGSISDLRYLLASDGKEGSQLPPTLGTLKPHIQRAFYMSRIWKNSVTSSPDVISPYNFGWYEDENGEYRPIICTKPSAPKALLELKQCGCQSNKDRCSVLRCGCFKNGFNCTDLCKCGEECKNRVDENNINDTEDISNLV